MTRTVTTLLAVTHVVVTLDTLLIPMDTHVMVCSYYTCVELQYSMTQCNKHLSYVQAIVEI